MLELINLNFFLVSVKNGDFFAQAQTAYWYNFWNHRSISNERI